MDRSEWGKWLDLNSVNFAVKARQGFRGGGRGFLKVHNMEKQEGTRVYIEYYAISSMYDHDILEILQAYNPEAEMCVLLESGPENTVSGFFRVVMPSPPS